MGTTTSNTMQKRGGAMTAFGSALKNKIVDKTSDVLSAPTRAYYAVKSRRSAMDADTLSKTRQMKNVPDFDASGSPSTASKYRAASEAIKKRLSK